MAHVSRSAYYKWASGKIIQREREDKRLAEVAEKIYCEHTDKGYRRINDALRHDYGIYVNDKRVLR